MSTQMSFARPMGASPLTFPRAEGRHSTESYYGFYRGDCKALMMAWLRVQLDDFFSLCYPMTRETLGEIEQDALIVAEELATREMARPVNAHETKLLGECIRDVLTAKALMNDLERERAREIL
jgi:hypothetical protein